MIVALALQPLLASRRSLRSARLVRGRSLRVAVRPAASLMATLLSPILTRCLAAARAEARPPALRQRTTLPLAITAQGSSHLALTAIALPAICRLGPKRAALGGVSSGGKNSGNGGGGPGVGSGAGVGSAGAAELST